MKTEQIALAPLAPGANLVLTVHRFGQPGAHPRVYIQGALHADEIPGMIAAHHVRERLKALEADGKIKGEIILVPAANPIGLAQRMLGTPVGRFDFSNGVNFNRGYPYLVPQVAKRVEARLTDDGDANVRAIREELRAELAQRHTGTPAEHLKKTLLGLAIDADIVLDLHCDSEAVMHLYTHTRSAEAFAPLCALLGTQAILLAEESGDDPFDEACSRPWAELADRFPDRPIPFACHSTTVEFRGESDVNHGMAGADAAAIIDFLILRGAVAGEVPVIPMASCAATPLAALEPVAAPTSGIVVFHVEPGQRVKEGDLIAEIIDPATGETSPVVTESEGMMFARILTRFAIAGQRVAKVAGTKVRRQGKLLGA